MTQVVTESKTWASTRLGQVTKAIPLSTMYGKSSGPSLENKMRASTRLIVRVTKEVPPLTMFGKSSGPDIDV